MSRAESLLVDVVVDRAQRNPEKLAFVYLEQGEQETDRLTFAELDLEARKIAMSLGEFVEPGERVLLIYPPGLDFVRAFYGCLYAGIVPIPTNAPGRNRSIQRLQAIGQDSQAKAGLTTPELLAIFQSQADAFPEFKPMQWLSHDMLQNGTVEQWKRRDVHLQDIAFIQYTSGSTAMPRGVVINYNNLLVNTEIIRQARQRENSTDSVIVTWVPQFHDMGLLVGVVQGVFDNQLSVLMSPIAFMQRPARWLEAITRYRGTASGGPNFSYTLCINKVTEEEYSRLDLSHWRLAYNSAEPVRKETQDEFVRKFSGCGFRYQSFQPCYGLAEATLLETSYGGEDHTLTFPADRTSLEEGIISPCENEGNCQHLVNCGSPLGESEIAIVDPVTCERCEPDKIGEIWISGDHISREYWNRPEETAKILQAKIKDTNEGPFLRTGDLGFMYDGDLYVTGRLKDMIIIRGRNYYPQDIEFTVEKCHPAMQPGGGAAFYLQQDGYEQLVVVQEVRRQFEENDNLSEVIKIIRQVIAREHGIRASVVVLIRRGSIPKTSSGKIMRHECNSLFLDGRLEKVAEWRAPVIT